jgi:hypothetical protein
VVDTDAVGLGVAGRRALADGLGGVGAPQATASAAVTRMIGRGRWLGVSIAITTLSGE